MKVKNKKSNATYILVLVLITLLSFFVYMNFFVDISSSAVSTADDVSCRIYLTMKDFPGMEIASFFYVIKGKCMVDDDVKIDLENREESFETIAHQMSRCWYRYGEGELDFLGNFDTTGKWCFLCGGIEMNNKNTNSFMFTDFIEWTKKNKYNDSLSYYEYIGVKYSDVDDNVVEEIRREYLEIINENSGSDAGLKNMVVVLGNQISYLEELKNKEIISSDEKVYVVYRYDRIDKSFQEKLENAGKTAMYSIGGSILASMISEALIQGAIFGVVGGVAGGGFGAIPGAIVGAVYGGGKAIKDIGTSFNKVFKVTKLIKKTKNLIKLSSSKNLISKSDDALRMERLTIAGKLTDVELSSRIKNFQASPDEIKIYAELIHTKDVKIAEDLQDIAKIMEEANIQNLDQISSRISILKQNNNKLLNDFESRIKIINDNDLILFAQKEADIIGEVKNLDVLKGLALDEIDNLKKAQNLNAQSDLAAFKDYLRVFIVLGSGAAGGYVGYNYNSNYEQYVDLLTREEYYKYCGTEGGNFK